MDGNGKFSWSPDGSHVYVCYDIGGGVMDVAKNEYEFTAGYFPHFAWSQDGRYFASVEEKYSEFTIWDTELEQEVQRDKQGNFIYALAWTPDGDLLALGVLNWETVLWNTSTGEILLRFYLPPRLSYALN